MKKREAGEVGFFDKEGTIYWVARKDIEGLSLQELLLCFDKGEGLN